MPELILDIEKIIRRARLRTTREGNIAVVSMLFQEIYKRDSSSTFHFREIIDDTRAFRENLPALCYRGQLWTLRGAGDWDWQMEQALSINRALFTHARVVENARRERELRAALDQDYSWASKTLQRIKEAVSFYEAHALDTLTKAVAGNKERKRL